VIEDLSCNLADFSLSKGWGLLSIARLIGLLTYSIEIV